VLAYWDGTFQASIDQQRDAGETATTSSSSTTARRSPTACRTTATCSPATSRTCPALPDDARPSASSAASAGTPTACPPSSRRAPARHQDHRRDPRARHREVQRGLPHLGAEVHRRVARYVTRQARWVDFDNDYKTMTPYMESSCGRSSSCGTRAWSTRASGSCPTAGTRDAAVQPRDCAWTTTSTAMRQDPALTVGFAFDLDRGDRRRRAARSGRRRRGRCRPTSRSRSARHRLRVVESDGTRRYVLGRGPARGVRPLSEDPRSSARSRARARSAAPTRRRSTTSPAPNAFRVLAGRLRHDRGRHRHRAHGARLR
jgi:hypothetical protein